jgi:NAD(P)-dependent dehydrogenase (short-subunit alcohol dehydrogenase family)
VPPDIGTVIVTGGASGLGAAVTSAVRRAGGCPVVLDRQCVDAPVDQMLVDLADSTAAADAVERVIARHGGLSGVVTCAGIDHPGRLADVAPSTWEAVIAVNLVGTAAVIRAAIPTLTTSRGRIVTVASTLGLRGVSDATAYCASKFGVIGFTRALAAELDGEVGVTMLVPGGMHTSFFDDRDEEYRPGPDAMLCRPEDVADAVVFALTRPPGVEVREMVVCPTREGSWP